MDNIVGQYLGRYHILEQLGEGGMATVYRAYDTRLERQVAVKIIRRGAFPADTLGEVMKRFEREAKSLARLSHPNIVKVHDFGEYENSPYLVLEYLPGGTLKNALGQPVPWQAALKLILPIARGVEYAHQHGIVHRDIKPANILITESGEPMLSDFGIAKILEGETSTALTGTGMAMGTPDYMAPEQWGGQTSSQSDQYSLAVVLFELVAGRKPYIADTPAAVLIKQATEPLPHPTDFAPDLPDEIEWVLIKALAKDPRERYLSMGEFAHALEELLRRGETVPTRPKTEPRDLPTLPPVIQTAAPRPETLPPQSAGRPDQTQPRPPEPKRRALFPLIGIGVILAVVCGGVLYGGRSLIFGDRPTATATREEVLAASAPTDPATPVIVPSESQPSTPINVALPLEIIDARGVAMRLVPAGEFTMGSNTGDPDEQPVHKIQLENFYIDKFEITNALYRACVESGVCEPPVNNGSATHSNYYGNAQYDSYPVIYVDWDMARNYCEWRAARLPTEAEWEKAARGSDERMYPWGNAADCQSANYSDCNNDTVPVGTSELGQSPYGIYDMAGNVWEWVSSKYSPYPYNALDGREDLATWNRVFRGGAWINPAYGIRTTYRSYEKQNYAKPFIGFRCANSADAVARRADTPTPAITPTAISNRPTGKIVFTCQVAGENHDQICLMNADGTNQRQLTHDTYENFYPSLAPDGRSIIFVSNATLYFEIYEMDLAGNTRQVTYGLHDTYAPEISPDGRLIVFTRYTGSFQEIWLVDRNGSNARALFVPSERDALDPTWSPDGQQVLFAMGSTESKHLYVINVDGSGLRQVSSIFVTRGRSDWSWDGAWMASYSGASWQRELFIMHPDGSDLHQISSGGNTLAPSFSPDSQWITFTGYIDLYGNDNGCEIYTMRLDGSKLTRLTNNNYCDYQPRWGP
jgi:serine/threonine-protein kinase